MMNHLKRWASDENAFSLIEVLIATSLIGIVAVSILSLFSTGIVRQRRLIEENKALYFAQEGIEQVIADRQQLGFDAVTNGEYPKQNRSGVERKIHIRPIGTDRKRISVVVTWNDLSDSLVSEICRY